MQLEIGIVGNYGNDNNGDEAILLSIIQQVTATFHMNRNQLTVFSNHPEQTATQYGVNSYPLYYKKGNAAKTFFATFHQNKKVVKKLDLLIIGGGGILMDLYRREAPLYGSYAMMAQQTQTPYIVYGCGAGPLETNLGKWFIRYMCKHAHSVSVRDPESSKLLQSVGVKKAVTVIGDPAFSLRLEADQMPVKQSRPQKIGVTAVPYYNATYWPEGNVEIYEQYIDGMAKNLDRLAAQHDVDIQFFATKFPQDADVTKDIQAKMKYAEKTSILDENLTPQRLLEVSSRLDLVIGTRLHSLILATCTETPIIAIAYHHKVKDFMKLAKLEDYVFPVDQLHQDDTYFINAYEAMATQWEEVCSNTSILSKRLYDAAMKGTEQMTNAIS